MSPSPRALKIAGLLLEHYDHDDVVWLHGQGSTFTGMAAEADVDLVVVWSSEAPVACGPVGHSLLPHGDVVLEKGLSDDVEVDLIHVPLSVFTSWMNRLEAGDGWVGPEWPLPMHAAAGLVTGQLLVDHRRVGAHMQVRARTPSAAFTARVHTALSSRLADFEGELVAADDRGDAWLHQHLASQLLFLTYTVWFATEGHYLPFPKRIGQWIDRFDLDQSTRTLERAVWTSRSDREQTSAIVRFGTCVVATSAAPGSAAI